MLHTAHASVVLLVLFACAGCGSATTSSTIPAPEPVTIPADASEGLRAALTLLNDPDPLRRAWGARQLGLRDEDPAALAAILLRVLQDPNPLVRSRAAESLGPLGESSAVLPLIARVEDRSEDREVRTRAAEALGRLGSRAAVGPLQQALEDPVWHIRHHAIVALGRLGDPAAKEALENAARYDPDPFNREEAGVALERLAAGG